MTACEDVLDPTTFAKSTRIFSAPSPSFSRAKTWKRLLCLLKCSIFSQSANGWFTLLKSMTPDRNYVLIRAIGRRISAYIMFVALSFIVCCCCFFTRKIGLISFVNIPRINVLNVFASVSGH